MSIQYLSAKTVKPRADIWPENDYHAGATVVIDDPREPTIVATGVLDANGDMLLRVTTPIKVKMGFAIPTHDEADEVVSIVPESLLGVSDSGLGVGFVTPEEAEAYDGEHDEEDDAPQGLRVVATPELIAAHTALEAATRATAAQVGMIQTGVFEEEAFVILRGLAAAQTEALIAFLRTCGQASEADDDADA